MSYKSSIRYTKNEPSAKAVYLEVHYDNIQIASHSLN